MTYAEASEKIWEESQRKYPDDDDRVKLKSMFYCYKKYLSHQDRLFKGEDIDPDSGIPTVYKMAWWYERMEEI